ncbi:MAG: hypothetical protein GEV07_20270 [Streptosporangiales bacterium]|nr:hypothetical protein [Streptosporangiales bacterium]
MAAGATLTYAWHGFPQHAAAGSDPTVDLIGNAVFATAAIVLLTAAARRLHRSTSVVGAQAL